MSDYWQGFITGFVFPGLAGLLGWLKWGHEIREKRRERAEKEKVQAELKLIRRRGEAPFLAINLARFENLYLSVGETSVACASPLKANLLCFNHEEAAKDIPNGTLIYLVIENRGSGATQIKITSGDEVIKIASEPDFNGAQGLVYLSYPYKPQLHGQIQKLDVWFESNSGIQDTHVYEMKHGLRYLKRIDPA